MDAVAVDVVVTGRVQGVCYRASLQEQAERRGVTGWARNERDGSVRAHLEGDRAALSDVVEWCASGPPAARVAAVERVEAPVTGARAFEVR
jgi:acylphosphatase